MRISKGSVGKSYNWKTGILAIFMCLIILLAGVSVILITVSPQVIVDAESSVPMSRGSRQVNTQHEPQNNYIDTADTVTYYTSGRIIDANISATNDPCDYWKIPINLGTKKFDTQLRIIGAENSIKLIILLDNQGAGTGLIMSLFDAEKHELGKSVVALPGGPQGTFTIVGQVNSEVYVKIYPAAGGTGNYRLTIYNTTHDYNPSFDDRNTFDTATKRNITKGFTKIEYLDYIYDNADFYSFDVVANQKLVIDMLPVSNCDFDLYLFNSKDPANWVAASTITGRGPLGRETIIWTSPTTNTYYLRVAVKIDGTWLGNAGNYTLTASGNIPPFWNSSFPTYYEVNEDSPAFTIEIEDAYYDVNPSDQISYEIYNPSKGSGAYDDPPSSFALENATIELIEDTLTPKIYIRVTPKEDKFGTETLHVRATDIMRDVWTKKNLTIRILPINDFPILNNTKLWLNGNILTPSSDGKKLTGREGELFNTKVTAYDPVDPWDVIRFYDNTELFEINPITGEISFTPTYHVTGTHFVNITARDNGTYPNETTTKFEFIIKRGNVYPIVVLDTPSHDSIQYTLRPEFKWEQTNDVFFGVDINYEFYLSANIDYVTNRNPVALFASLNDTYYSLTEDLLDNTTYYWTVIPNDGVHLGECESGIRTFETNKFIEIPHVKLKTPFDNQMLDSKDVLLTWDLVYKGIEPIKYDIYFEVSLEDMLDRNRTPFKDKITTNSLEIQGLYTDKYYYWQVIPWTPKVRLSPDESEIRSFYVTSQIPHITLITPINKTIQYDNWVTFNWEVNFTNPGQVVCELYYGTVTPFTVQKLNFTGTYSYSIYNLDEKEYYWKIVPYIGLDLRGTESERRIFTIERNPSLLRTELLEPVNITVYSQFITLSWKRILSSDVDVATVWYEIYLDNSTSDPAKMERIEPKYRNINIIWMLPLEPRKTYYWYVIPHGDTPDAHIRGYCSSGVVHFIFDYASPKFDFKLEMEETYLKISPGTSKYFHFKLTNLGNRETTISLSTSINAAENLDLTLATKLITLSLSGTERINVTVLALPKAESRNYTATVTAQSKDDLNITKTDTISIEITGGQTDGKPDGDKDGDDKGSNTLLIGAVAAVIIIIIILIVVLLLVRKRKTKQTPATTQPQPGSEADQTGRVQSSTAAVTPVQPVTPTRPVTPAQPAPARTPVRPVAPVQPVRPAPAPAQTQARPPVTPVRPVSPVKPVQPVKPV